MELYLHTRVCVCVCIRMCLCRYMCVCIVLYNDYIHCDLEVCAISLLIQQMNHLGFFPFQQRHVNTGPKINFFTDFCTNLQKMFKVRENLTGWGSLGADHELPFSNAQWIRFAEALWREEQLCCCSVVKLGPTLCDPMDCSNSWECFMMDPHLL